MKGGARRWRSTALVAVAAVLAWGGLAPLGAQEFTLTLGRSTSDYREFSGALGWGGDISVLPDRTLGLRVGVRRHADDGVWVRSRCVGLIPPDSELCADDRFEGSYSWWSVGLGPEVRVPLGNRWEASASALVSRIWIDGAWEGQASGFRIGRPFEDSVLGFTLAGGVRWALDSRWGLSLSGRVDDPQFTTCVSDTYDPFCDGGALRTLEVGMSVRR